MNTVSKGLLKAKMLEYFRKIEETGEALIVTDRSKPVLKIIPIREKQPCSELFKDVRGKAEFRGDLTEPTLSEWSLD